MNTFENAKVGDRVWSPIFGWGAISAIHYDERPMLTVDATDKGTYKGTYRFLLNGKFSWTNIQLLFWKEMDFVPKPVEKPTKFDPNKPYRLRNGNEVTILKIKKDGCFIVYSSEIDMVFVCYEDGYYRFDKVVDAYDLVNIPANIILEVSTIRKRD